MRGTLNNLPPELITLIPHDFESTLHLRWTSSRLFRATSNSPFWSRIAATHLQLDTSLFDFPFPASLADILAACIRQFNFQQKKKEARADNDRPLPLRDHRVLEMPSGVCKFDFLPGGKHAVSAHKDHTIRLWELKGGRLLASHYIEFPSLALNFKVVGSSLVVVTTGDSNYAVWTFAFGKGDTETVTVEENWKSTVHLGNDILESRIQDDYAFTLGHGQSDDDIGFPNASLAVSPPATLPASVSPGQDIGPPHGWTDGLDDVTDEEEHEDDEVPRKKRGGRSTRCGITCDFEATVSDDDDDASTEAHFGGIGTSRFLAVDFKRKRAVHIETGLRTHKGLDNTLVVTANQDVILVGQSMSSLSLYRYDSICQHLSNAHDQITPPMLTLPPNSSRTITFDSIYQFPEVSLGAPITRTMSLSSRVSADHVLTVFMGSLRPSPHHDEGWVDNYMMTSQWLDIDTLGRLLDSPDAFDAPTTRRNFLIFPGKRLGSEWGTHEVAIGSCGRDVLWVEMVPFGKWNSDIQKCRVARLGLVSIHVAGEAPRDMDLIEGVRYLDIPDDIDLAVLDAPMALCDETGTVALRVPSRVADGEEHYTIHLLQY